LCDYINKEYNLEFLTNLINKSPRKLTSQEQQAYSDQMD
jgi:hypothetical protein